MLLTDLLPIHKLLPALGTPLPLMRVLLQSTPVNLLFQHPNKLSNMKKTILLGLFCSTLLTAAAQSQQLLELQHLEEVTPPNHQLLFFSLKIEDPKILHEQRPDWSDAVLLTNDQDTFQVKALYHPIYKEVWIHFFNATYRLYPQKVLGIAIGEKTYVSLEYQNNDQLYCGYFELLSEGVPALLRTPNVPHSKKRTAYWVKSFDNPPTPFSPSNKSILKLFTRHKAKIEHLLKSKQLNAKKAEDLVYLFDYYHELNKR